MQHEVIFSAPNPKPYESSILTLSCFFNTHFIIIISPLSMSFNFIFSPQVIWLKSMYFSYLSFVLHVPPSTEYTAHRYATLYSLLFLPTP